MANQSRTSFKVFWEKWVPKLPTQIRQIKRKIKLLKRINLLKLAKRLYQKTLLNLLLKWSKSTLCTVIWTFLTLKTIYFWWLQSGTGTRRTHTQIWDLFEILTKSKRKLKVATKSNLPPKRKKTRKRMKAQRKNKTKNKRIKKQMRVKLWWSLMLLLLSNRKTKKLWKTSRQKRKLNFKRNKLRKLQGKDKNVLKRTLKTNLTSFWKNLILISALKTTWFLISNNRQKLLLFWPETKNWEPKSSFQLVLDLDLSK